MNAACPRQHEPLCARHSASALLLHPATCSTTSARDAVPRRCPWVICHQSLPPYPSCRQQPGLHACVWPAGQPAAAHHDEAERLPHRHPRRPAAARHAQHDGRTEVRGACSGGVCGRSPVAACSIVHRRGCFSTLAPLQTPLDSPCLLLSRRRAVQEVRALHRDDSSSASLRASSSSVLDGPGPSGLLPPVPEGAAPLHPAAAETERQQPGRSGMEGHSGAAERSSGGSS